MVFKTKPRGNAQQRVFVAAHHRRCYAAPSGFRKHARVIARPLAGVKSFYFGPLLGPKSRRSKRQPLVSGSAASSCFGVDFGVGIPAARIRKRKPAAPFDATGHALTPNVSASIQVLPLC